MNQKGFANIILIVVTVVLVGAVAYFALVKKSEPVAQQPSSTPTDSTSTTLAPATQNQTANWENHINSKVGFTFKYPKEWRIEDAARIESPFIKSVLGFGPQDKIYYYRGGTMNPVSIEVSTGDPEQIFGTIYPALETWDRKSINNYSVLVAENQLGEIFYVFEHPTEKNTRIAFRSEIDMLLKNIPERNIKRDELINVFNQILSTFKFIK